MKKVLSVILIVALLVSSLSTISLAGYTADKSLRVFTQDLVGLISDSYETNVISDQVDYCYSNSDSQDDIVNENTSTNRLIIKSSCMVDELNSVACIGGYNDLYILQLVTHK